MGAPSSPLLFTASATAVTPSLSSPLLPSASPLARFRAGITAVTTANRIERLRGDAPSASTNPLYSDETLQQRAALVRHPAVQRELDILWGVAVAPRRQLHKAEYLTMHRKMVLALQPNTAPREAEQLAESDWPATPRASRTSTATASRLPSSSSPTCTLLRSPATTTPTSSGD